jgi:hypothetical protein
MSKARAALLVRRTQTPYLLQTSAPAETSTEHLHWDWYSKRDAHFNCIATDRSILDMEQI